VFEETRRGEAMLWRFLFMVAALATGVAFLGAASAGAEGNSRAAEFCRMGGWKTLGTSDEQVFRTVGDCTSYGAHGGVLVPLLQAIVDETCILDPNVPPSSACFTVKGFGLEPGSEVRVSLVIEGEELLFPQIVDGEGKVHFETSAGCVPGEEKIVLSLSASGVTATGISLATPEESVSLFCTRF
jgi:hypothetical protein